MRTEWPRKITNNFFQTLQGVLHQSTVVYTPLSGKKQKVMHFQFLLVQLIDNLIKNILAKKKN